MIINKNKEKTLFQNKPNYTNTFNYCLLNPLLGEMLAIADQNTLYLLEFTNSKGLERKIKRLQEWTKSNILTGYTQPIHSIEQELNLYFKGDLTQFNTPCAFTGSSFQESVWKELIKIPYGKTFSYIELATAIGRLKAYRAVALANAANQLAIIIPCHRVIHIDKTLGGYAGGISRKEWLLNHELYQSQ